MSDPRVQRRGSHAEGAVSSLVRAICAICATFAIARSMTRAAFAGIRSVTLLVLLGTMVCSAHADTLSPERRAAAHALAVSQNLPLFWPLMAKKMASTAGQELRDIGQQALARNPSLSEEERSRRSRRVDALALEATDSVYQRLKAVDASLLMDDMMVAIYAPRFTADEMNEMARFLQSEVGQKWLRVVVVDGPSALPAATEKWSVAERYAVGTFIQLPVFEKFKVLNPDINREVSEFYRSRINRMTREIGQAYADRMQALTEAAPSR